MKTAFMTSIKKKSLKYDQCIHYYQDFRLPCFWINALTIYIIITKILEGDIIKLEFLGGAREIGKSGFLLDNKIALDYGLKLEGDAPIYLPSLKVNAVLLSHAHLDHCGSIPALYKNGRPTIFSTSETADLSKLIIKDSYKISLKNNYKAPFGKRELRRTYDGFKNVDYYNPFKLEGFDVEYYDAGHIPGSAGILLNKNGKKIFYTGDINLSSTYLLNGATLPKKTDILIMESTYGDREHVPRDEEEKRFVKAINDGLANDEKILLPCFAIGRSHEILLILNKYKYKKIAIDGMIKQTSEITLYYKNNIKNYNNLKKILDKVTWIRGNRERNEAMKTKDIIVTTSGMMTGGPIVYFLRELKDQKIRILFTGYLVEDTPGRKLLETGIFSNKEEEFKIDAPVFKFDMSAHSGRSELFEIVRKMQPKKVFIVHGDNTQKFANDLSSEFKDIEFEAPAIGDVFEI